MTTHQPAALPEFTDERVQSVYTLLCDEQAAPPGEHWEGWVARRIVAALQSQPAAAGVSDAATKDAVFEASIEFIGTLTGMQPPPIETAPPEVFNPFRDFTEKVCAILALRPQAVPMTETELIDAQSHYIRSRPMFADTKSFADGIRYAEAHHGITAQGAQVGEAK